MHSRTFSFPSVVVRDDADYPVTVTAKVEAYADSRGVPSEFRDRFTGRYDVSVVDVQPDTLALTDDEREALQEEAAEKEGYYR